MPPDRTRRPRVALLALTALLAACAHAPQGQAADFLSPLRLPAPDGSAWVSVPALRDKVVLVSFFATWCAPCLVQMAELRTLHQRYAEKGLEVIAVGMDLEGPLVLEPFEQLYALPFPVVVASDAIRSGSTAYGKVTALPETVLLRRDGSVARSFSGAADREQLNDWIRHELDR